MSLVISAEPPEAKDWVRLRASVGWNLFAVEKAAEALAKTSFCVTAYENGELVGMARVVDDGCIVFNIHDVIVVPERQHNGVGDMLMNEVMKYISKNAAPNALVALMSILDMEGFYERYGFVKRPNEKSGCGMSFRYDEAKHKFE